MSPIERYLLQLCSQLHCNLGTKEELKEEFKDHLMLLKKEYLEKGLSEENAEKCAVYDFGEYKSLQQALDKTVNPFKKILYGLNWILMGVYMWLIIMACFIGKFDNLSYVNNERGVTLRFDGGFILAIT